MARKSISHDEFRTLLSKHPGRWPDFEKEWGVNQPTEKSKTKEEPKKEEPCPKERIKPFGSFFKGLMGHKHR